MEKRIAGGSGGTAGLATTLARPQELHPRRLTRWLENERLLAALLLNRHFRGKRIVRASMLLPFIVPTVLSTFAWRWMFDPTFSVLNWLLYQSGLIANKLPFLSNGEYGMWC